MSCSFAKTLSLACGAAAAYFQCAAYADIRLPALISNNMVLQQDMAANVWGSADPGENVTVKLRDTTATATTGADGKWSVKLKDLKPGEAGEMTIAGKNILTIQNVLVGEVWVCSGQSNMEMNVASSGDAENEIAKANYPLIRMFTVQRIAQLTEQSDCTGAWEICSPETVGHFSAVAYYFARTLQDKMPGPIGLIHSSWGGTPAEYWTPTDVVASNPAYKGIQSRWDELKANYPHAKAEYDASVERWKQAVEKAQTNGSQPPPHPEEPRGNTDFGAPGCLFNGMIAPLLPYTIRGTIWYQGESNASEATLYETLFPAMIKSWRQRWGLGEFPFLFVQIANFMDRESEPTDTDWARLRDAQRKALSVPHTGMATIIDVGDGENIHPQNKQAVGKRLAAIALATVYYQDVPYSGPLYAAAQKEDGKIRLTFRYSEGMKPSDGDKLKGFAIAGEDHKFVWADTVIHGDHIIVSSPQVPNPVAVRYAWANNPECNLTNASGFPAVPFRTDDWSR